jgi:hypothetical protein
MLKEKLTQKLKDTLTKMLLFNHDEDYDKACMMAQMFLINRQTGGKLDKAIEMYKDLQRIEKNDKFFNEENN